MNGTNDGKTCFFWTSVGHLPKAKGETEMHVTREEATALSILLSFLFTRIHPSIGFQIRSTTPLAKREYWNHHKPIQQKRGQQKEQLKQKARRTSRSHCLLHLVNLECSVAQKLVEEPTPFPRWCLYALWNLFDSSSMNVCGVACSRFVCICGGCSSLRWGGDMRRRDRLGGRGLLCLGIRGLGIWGESFVFTCHAKVEQPRSGQTPLSPWRLCRFNPRFLPPFLRPPYFITLTQSSAANFFNTRCELPFAFFNFWEDLKSIAMSVPLNVNSNHFLTRASIMCFVTWLISSFYIWQILF